MNVRRMIQWPQPGIVGVLPRALINVAVVIRMEQHLHLSLFVLAIEFSITKIMTDQHSAPNAADLEYDEVISRRVMCKIRVLSRP